jgi:hypothetical protein
MGALDGVVHYAKSDEKDGWFFSCLRRRSQWRSSG